jgi:DNA-directed RNA polymerase alpha subunit
MASDHRKKQLREAQRRRREKLRSEGKTELSLTIGSIAFEALKARSIDRFGVHSYTGYSAIIEELLLYGESMTSNPEPGSSAVLSKPIETLGLHEDALVALKRAGILKLRDLVSLTGNQLMHVEGFGLLNVAKTKELLEPLGLTFALKRMPDSSR